MMTSRISCIVSENSLLFFNGTGWRQTTGMQYRVWGEVDAGGFEPPAS